MSSRVEPPSQSALDAGEYLGPRLAVDPLDDGEDEDAKREHFQSPRRDAWNRFKRNRAAMLALAATVGLLIAAICAPWMHTVNPLSQDYGSLDLRPSPQHWFGTDNVGRDQYSRLLYGLRIPLTVALIGTAITVVIGAMSGVVAGYFGGWVDSLLCRFTDVMFAFPGFLLALIVVSLFGPALDPYFGGGGRVILLTIVFSLVSWPPLMRFVRSLALNLREQQFIEAARACGSSGGSIIMKHLLPNMWGLVLVQASFIVAAVISTETVLSIFGLGVEPPNPDLGQMLYDGVQHIGLGYSQIIFPSIVLATLILSFTLLGNGLRDALDPRSHG